MKKILSAGRLPDEVAAKYDKEFILIQPPEERRFNQEELTERLADVHGYLGGPLTKEMIDKAPLLEIASSNGAGYDLLDHIYAGEKGIWVMNAPHKTTKPTAELTITLMLCLSRRVFNFYNLTKKEGKCPGISPFVDAFDSAPAPTPVHDKVLGIVGFGKIGKEVAKRAQGLDMEVIYYDVYRAPEALEKELNVKYVSFEELLKTADYVTLHCLMSPENYHLMGAEQFKMMKPSAYFINCGRGKLMDEKALIEALKNNEIRGAALDVFEFEPEISPELFELESVVIAPHIGTATRESRVGMAIEAMDGITAQLKGGESPTIVNREYYKAKA